MPLTVEFFVIQTLNGVQLAMLLFLLAIGLSVVLGMMNFINLAHGSLYMLGAYFALSAVRWFDSFWIALLLAPLGVAAVGAILYLALLRRLQSESPMRQVLVTFGLIFIGFDVVRIGWGLLPHVIEAPPLLSGSIIIAGQPYPLYRLFIIALGTLILGLLHVAIEGTRVGAIMRAGVDNRVMTSALGVNIDRVFVWVFSLGCYLAGVAGVVSAPVFSIFPGMEMSILILALIVVVVGGPGSLKGTALGALIIGIADTYGQVLMPAFARVTIYALMVIILLLRPGGLFPLRSTT